MPSQISWESILRRAASAGRDAILSNYDAESRRSIVKRGAGGDLTLKIDAVSERAIFDSLTEDLGRGSFVFFSEEMGEVESSGTRKKNKPLPVVICDPLDGSHNAQVGIPLFSISLSVIEPGKTRTFGNVTAGLILSVKTNDEYFASRGRGAFHNGVKLERRPGLIKKIETLLVETGDIDFLRDELIKNLHKKLIYKIRILGSAAISYCLLADGTADALIFAQPGGARTIDSPAGYLIARESGCFFADLSGRYLNIDKVRVSFDSRIDLLGAPNQKTLMRLKRLVRVL